MEDGWEGERQLQIYGGGRRARCSLTLCGRQTSVHRTNLLMIEAGHQGYQGLPDFLLCLP